MPFRFSITSLLLAIQVTLAVEVVYYPVLEYNSSSDISILFVGNSYTGGGVVETFKSVVDLLVGRRIIRSITVDLVAPGGQRLSQHAVDLRQPGSELGRRLNSATYRYDLVVLQEQSQLLSFPLMYSGVSDSVKASTVLAKAFAEKGTKTAMFLTWGYRDGDQHNPWRNPDYQTMQNNLEEGYCYTQTVLAASGIQAFLLPAGMSFEAANRSGDTANFRGLYDSDGSHPSHTGNYLASITFAQYIFGLNISVMERTNGISVKQRDDFVRYAKAARLPCAPTFPPPPPPDVPSWAPVPSARECDADCSRSYVAAHNKHRRTEPACPPLGDLRLSEALSKAATSLAASYCHGTPLPANLTVTGMSSVGIASFLTSPAALGTPDAIAAAWFQQRRKGNFVGAEFVCSPGETCHDYLQAASYEASELGCGESGEPTGLYHCIICLYNPGHVGTLVPYPLCSQAPAPILLPAVPVAPPEFTPTGLVSCPSTLLRNHLLFDIAPCVYNHSATEDFFNPCTAYANSGVIFSPKVFYGQSIQYYIYPSCDIGDTHVRYTFSSVYITRDVISQQERIAISMKSRNGVSIAFFKESSLSDPPRHFVIDRASGMANVEVVVDVSNGYNARKVWFTLTWQCYNQAVTLPEPCFAFPPPPTDSRCVIDHGQSNGVITFGPPSMPPGIFNSTIIYHTKCRALLEGAVRVTFLSLSMGTPKNFIHVDLGPFDPISQKAIGANYSLGYSEDNQLTHRTLQAVVSTPSFHVTLMSDNAVQAEGIYATYECLCADEVPEVMNTVTPALEPAAAPASRGACGDLTPTAIASISLRDLLDSFCPFVGGPVDTVLPRYLNSPNEFGASFAMIGDVNGDCLDDMAVGMPSASSGRGVVWILFLDEELGLKDAHHDKLKMAQDPVVSNTHQPWLAPQAEFGSSLAAVGDLDCDGVPDIVVGAPGASSGFGAIYLLYLDRGGHVKSSVFVSATLPDIKLLLSPTVHTHWGSSVAYYDTFDVEGMPSTIIAVGMCPDQGWNLNSSLTDSALIFVAFHHPPNVHFKVTVAVPVALGDPMCSDFNNGRPEDVPHCGGFCQVTAVGDIDGDGVMDLMVGTPNWISKAAQPDDHYAHLEGSVLFIRFSKKDQSLWPPSIAGWSRYDSGLHAPAEGYGLSVAPLVSSVPGGSSTFDVLVSSRGPNAAGKFYRSRLAWKLNGAPYKAGSKLSQETVCDIMDSVSFWPSFPNPSYGRRAEFIGNMGLAGSDLVVGMSFGAIGEILFIRYRGAAEYATQKPRSCANSNRLDIAAYPSYVAAPVASTTQCHAPPSVMPACAYLYALNQDQPVCMLKSATGFIRGIYVSTMVAPDSNLVFVQEFMVAPSDLLNKPHSCAVRLSGHQYQSSIADVIEMTVSTANGDIIGTTKTQSRNLTLSVPQGALYSFLVKVDILPSIFSYYEHYSVDYECTETAITQVSSANCATMSQEINGADISVCHIDQRDAGSQVRGWMALAGNRRLYVLRTHCPVITLTLLREDLFSYGPSHTIYSGFPQAALTKPTLTLMEFFTSLPKLEVKGYYFPYSFAQPLTINSSDISIYVDYTFPDLESVTVEYSCSSTHASRPFSPCPTTTTASSTRSPQVTVTPSNVPAPSATPTHSPVWSPPTPSPVPVSPTTPPRAPVPESPPTPSPVPASPPPPPRQVPFSYIPALQALPIVPPNADVAPLVASNLLDGSNTFPALTAVVTPHFAKNLMPTAISPRPSPAPKASGSSLQLAIIIIPIVLVVVLVALGIFLFVLYRRQKRNKRKAKFQKRARPLPATDDFNVKTLDENVPSDSESDHEVRLKSWDSTNDSGKYSLSRV